ncbi:PREDICTED: protein ANTAGONIST OF LIKE HETEROCHROMATIN PROTEIN 1-like, partial [Amphimedon queenslandica]|uniref:DDE Tnp4 domain-containing protein n=1 Tax=Amphimedon queenslandica TaxID=400682 RepID=A0AAN0IUG1_AMPQE
MADFTTLMLLGYLLMVLVVSRTHLMRKKRVHRLWVRKIFRERERLGFYNTLLSQLRLSDTEYFFRFIRMTPRRFDDLLSIVGPYIQRKSCRSRRVISAGERLAVCLRYLATGDSQQTQSFSFRIGRSTVCKIIHETCDAIWTALRSKYLKAPASLEDWKNIAKGFHDEWNFPTCVGAIDGKHVCIECPKNAGSAYYNYKNFHRSYGRDNDASIFAESSI